MTRVAGALCAWLALALLATAAHAQQVELRWSHPRAFVHEQVQLEALVEHPVGLNPRWEAPAFDGFAIERLPSEGSTMRRGAGGGYVRTTRLRHALFPTRVGVIEVAASRIVFVDGNGRESVLAVPGTRLAVESLPETGRPPDFDAVVGQLGVRATLAPASIALGEFARLELDVFGVANVWDAVAPDLQAALGPGCEVFVEPAQVDRNVHDEKLFARKTFRFSLVPGAVGHLAIPALRVAHFDPERGVYRTASSDPLDLEVLPARTPASAEPARVPEPAHGAGGSAWLPTALLLANALGVLVALARRPRPAPLPRASSVAAPAPAGAPRAAPEELLRHAEASLEEPSFGALLSRALRARCASDPASLTTSELAARTSDAELVALLRAIDAERFSGETSLERRRTLLDAAAAYLHRART